MQADLFVERARARWNRLAALLEEAEKVKANAFGRAKLEETLRLYRQAGSDLAQARALTSRREILDPLNDLVSRGHRILYPPGEVKIKANLARFFARDLPAAFRRRWRAIAMAAAAMLAGALVGAGAVVVDRDNAARLVPGNFYTESPQERVKQIESGKERIETLDDALTFGASLYAHNIRVSFLAFGLAAVTGLGGLALLFFNGVLLGAVAASYTLDGVTTFFVAWVGPHGALELPAIVFGGAAGFVLARALYLPGNRTLSASLRNAVPDVSRILTAVVLQLLIAGLVEGSFSQFSRTTFSYGLKISVAAVLFSSLLLYLFLPRGEGGPMTERVLTPDGSLVDVNPAGLGARFLALMLDTTLVMGALALASGLTQLVLPTGINFALMAVLNLFASMFYCVFCEMRLAGQTLGKKLLGLRVMDAQASQLVLSQSIVRNVARTVDFLPLFYGLGGLTALGDRLGRRLGDIMAGTVVVQERRDLAPPTFEVKPWNETSLTRADVRRRALARLSLEERDFVFKVVDREGGLTAATRFDLFEDAARHYRRRLQLPEVEGLSSENFIRIVAAALDDRSVRSRRMAR